MKTGRKVLALVFLVALMLSLCVTASAEGTTYTVRIYAGNQGTLKVGDGTVWTQTLPVGSTVSFDPDIVELPEGSKYYVRGIREAGLDNDAIAYSSFVVDRDIDYVVAYGILSSAVQYTVNYVSTGGETLAASRTYYGNVGDKPVVAYLYVEDYVPQAYNLTQTLKENAADNVFTFVYSPVPTTTVVTPVVPAGGNNQGNDQNNAQGNDQNAQGNDQNAEGQTPEEGVPGGTQVPAENPQPEAEPENNTPAEPEEIIDLDVPLAEPDVDETAEASSSSAAGIVAGCVGGAVVVLGLWYILAARKKKKNDQAD